MSEEKDNKDEHAPTEEEMQRCAREYNAAGSLYEYSLMNMPDRVISINGSLIGQAEGEIDGMGHCIMSLYRYRKFGYLMVMHQDNLEDVGMAKITVQDGMHLDDIIKFFPDSPMRDEIVDKFDEFYKDFWDKKEEWLATIKDKEVSEYKY